MRDPVGQLKLRRRVLYVFAAYAFLVGFQGECQQETRAWRAMETRTASLLGPNGEKIEFIVKVADDETERQAGFQHVCPRTISQTPMLFVFPRSARISFHMHNVHAPLQIGFFDADGVLVDLQLMKTYGPLPAGQRRLYDPGKPIRAALETEVGFFRKHGIVPGQWRLIFPFH